MIHSGSLPDLLNELEAQLLLDYNASAVVADPTHVPATALSDPRAGLWLHGPTKSPGVQLYHELFYALEAATACASLPIDMLVKMNLLAPDTLGQAYDVCEKLWNEFGEDLADDESIDGGDVVDALAQLAGKLDNVMAWSEIDDAAAALKLH